MPAELKLGNLYPRPYVSPLPCVLAACCEHKDTIFRFYLTIHRGISAPETVFEGVIGTVPSIKMLIRARKCHSRPRLRLRFYREPDREGSINEPKIELNSAENIFQKGALRKSSSAQTV